MALPRRLRFEILRRDKHTCRYCGRSAPDVKLEVDHVIPSALGGTDEPSNLVTACSDCNSGKASVPADAPIVADVSERALRWAAAICEAQFWMAADAGLIEDARVGFKTAWDRWGTPTADGGIEPFPLPVSWPQSVAQWKRRGITTNQLMDLVDESMYRDNVKDRWTYFCGVVWRHLDDQQARALRIVETDPSTWATQQQ